MTGEEALEILEREEVDLVLLDLMLPGMHGMQVLREIRRRDPDLVVVVITAYSSIESAIEAMREGAFHYIPKPFKNEEVLLTVRKGLEQRRLRDREPVAPRPAPPALRVRQHRRQGQADAAGLRADPARGAGQEQHPGPRRERHGQGAGRQGDPPPLAARQRPVHHRQLGLDAGRPAGEQPLRPPARRLHRRGGEQEGALRAGQQRLDLLRRDRQHPDRHPGQAPPGDPGEGVHAPGRHRHDPGGRADHRRHQRRPRGARCSRGPSARTSTTG